MPKTKRKPIIYLLFMDASGDTGFKFKQDSSRFFALTLVIFDNPLRAEITAKKIKKFREELKLPAKFEFKSSTGTTKKQKAGFLKSLHQENFTYRTMVIDKEKLIPSLPSFEGYALLAMIRGQVDVMLDPFKGQPWYEACLWGGVAQKAGFCVTNLEGKDLDISQIIKFARAGESQPRVPIVISNHPRLHEQVLKALTNQEE